MAEKYTLANGQPLTDELVDQLVDEAERGYDVDELEKKRGRGRPALGGGPSTVLPVRLDPELQSALKKKVEQTGQSRSDLVRKALREYLAA
ncbi:MAG: CopG family ribbon-helix-helix protein [Nesterenkonia sp.]